MLLVEGPRDGVDAVVPGIPAPQQIYFQERHSNQSWPIVKIAINSNSNSSERSLSNSNTNSNSLEVSLAIAIPIAIVPKMVNSNSKSIAIVQILLLKCALQGVLVLNIHFYSI